MISDACDSSDFNKMVFGTCAVEVKHFYTTSMYNIAGVTKDQSFTCTKCQNVKTVMDISTSLQTS